MRVVNLLCASLLGLVASINVYAGVTADGTTAYRSPSVQAVLFFTDNPADEPNSVVAPLWSVSFHQVGVAGYACSYGSGRSLVNGLVCDGISGKPIDTSTCEPTDNGFTATTTTWCLFSENLRIGGKAWAVKYVNGFIPTNDGVLSSAVMGITYSKIALVRITHQQTLVLQVAANTMRNVCVS